MYGHRYFRKNTLQDEVIGTSERTTTCLGLILTKLSKYQNGHYFFVFIHTVQNVEQEC